VQHIEQNASPAKRDSDKSERCDARKASSMRHKLVHKNGCSFPHFHIFTLMKGHQLIIYTDGAARGNPGPGGYGVILMWGEKRKEISAGYRLTTNNRMELMAVIVALELLTKKNIPLTIYTDSQYILNAVQQKWLDNWIRTDFKGGKKNKDLWLRFYKLSKDFDIKFVWVRGHADNPFNNRCDELATAAADGKNLLIDEVYEKQKGTLFE
jgi:ribonuclease HI